MIINIEHSRCRQSDMAYTEQHDSGEEAKRNGREKLRGRRRRRGNEQKLEKKQGKYAMKREKNEKEKK